MSTKIMQPFPIPKKPSTNISKIGQNFGRPSLLFVDIVNE